MLNGDESLKEIKLLANDILIITAEGAECKPFLLPRKFDLNLNI